jgi:hypothetical protein
MKNLAKAVIAVMKEVKGMEKNSKIGEGKMQYNGTKDQDVKEVFNEALAKNGLCIIPIGIEEETVIDRWEEQTQWGAKVKQNVFTKVKTKYLLLHESGESQEIAGYGHGVDPQDKGAGKATTYALKNALLYTFLTPVGKIDDTDTTHSDNIPVPLPKPQTPPQKIAITPETFAKAVTKADGDPKSFKLLMDKFDLTIEQKDQVFQECLTKAGADFEKLKIIGDNLPLTKDQADQILDIINFQP